MRKLENKRIDEIGKMLVKAGTMPSREIEKLVDTPGLFEGVQRRISLGETGQPTRRRSILRPVTAGFAGVALVVAIAFAFVSFRSAGVDNAALQQPQQPAPRSEPIRKSAEPDRIIPAGLPQTEPVPRLEKTASRTTPSVRTPRPKREPTPQQIRFVDDFYAVSYAGDPHETERGGRIVRVDIPRSTLFAMGINVPLENESATVKADLLIGSDGVTRGIRVVE